MGRRDELHAELAALELGERLVELKADPKADPDELQQVKQDLRTARYEYRTLRDGNPPEESLGDATVRPEPVKATAEAKSPGGKG